jgi:hypothetical protein
MWHRQLDRSALLLCHGSVENAGLLASFTVDRCTNTFDKGLWRALLGVLYIVLVHASPLSNVRRPYVLLRVRGLSGCHGYVCHSAEDLFEGMIFPSFATDDFLELHR